MLLIFRLSFSTRYGHPFAPNFVNVELIATSIAGGDNH
jgi:hypothetical protein